LGFVAQPAQKFWKWDVISELPNFENDVHKAEEELLEE
jgi:hypothetical protein